MGRFPGCRCDGPCRLAAPRRRAEQRRGRELGHRRTSVDPTCPRRDSCSARKTAQERAPTRMRISSACYKTVAFKKDGSAQPLCSEAWAATRRSRWPTETGPERKPEGSPLAGAGAARAIDGPASGNARPLRLTGSRLPERHAEATSAQQYSVVRYELHGGHVPPPARANPSSKSSHVGDSFHSGVRWHVPCCSFHCLYE